MSLEENVSKFNSDSIIEIYGLGYVGFPLAVRLASSGIKTIGIDTNSERISRLEKNELMDSEIHLLARQVWSFRRSCLTSGECRSCCKLRP